MLAAFILKRLLWAIPFLFAVSIVAFALIQAPPGDYLTTFAAKEAPLQDDYIDCWDGLEKKFDGTPGVK